jgi:uncharacterized membrane protein
MDDPWLWLSAGWRDLWRSPVYSLAYGAVFTVISLLITGGLWAVGLTSLIPAAAACFVIAGPIMAVGLYEISRRQESGEPVNLRAIVNAKIASPVQLGLICFLLLFIALVWMRAATLIYALFTYGVYLPLDQFAAFALGNWQGMMLVGFGTAVGAILALCAFSVSVLSIPILMRHDIDAASAVIASVKAVIRWPGPMLLWAWLIGVMVFFGVATYFLGLIFVFPLLGHATWHAYRALVSGGPQKEI